MLRTILSVAITLSCLTCVNAGTPLGGLAVTISPDGSTLLAGGDNRTLYVLDPETLEVKQRVWTGTTIVALSCNKDGSRIIMQDSDGVVHLLNSSDYKKVSQHDELEKIAVARDTDVAAGLDDNYQGNAVRFFSMTDGSELGKVLFQKGDRVQSFGLNSAGDKVAVLMEGKNDDSEKKVSYSDVPKELKDLARDEFRLKNDGKTAMFATYKVPSGEKIAEHKLFYTSSATTKIIFDGDDALVINYSNDNARIKPDGTVEMFELNNSYNYGIGISPTQSLILTGGMRNGSITKVDGMTANSFRVQTLPGWPEYFKDFCTDGKGSVYATTSGFRVIKLTNEGRIVKEAGCF